MPLEVLSHPFVRSFWSWVWYGPGYRYVPLLAWLPGWILEMHCWSGRGSRDLEGEVVCLSSRPHIAHKYLVHLSLHIANLLLLIP